MRRSTLVGTSHIHCGFVLKKGWVRSLNRQQNEFIYLDDKYKPVLTSFVFTSVAHSTCDRYGRGINETVASPLCESFTLSLDTKTVNTSWRRLPPAVYWTEMPSLAPGLPGLWKHKDISRSWKVYETAKNAPKRIRNVKKHHTKHAEVLPSKQQSQLADLILALTTACVSSLLTYLVFLNFSSNCRASPCISKVDKVHDKLLLEQWPA